jgi:predicted N-acetyltransferase YhbS
MNIKIRSVTPADHETCGRIAFSAFQALADHHNFAPEFASADIAIQMTKALIAHPKFFGVAAEESGQVVGCNFVDFRSPIAGIGPISVDPVAQNRGIGRRLMEAAMNEASSRQCVGTRLVQAAYHNRSLCLYTALGFRTREPLSIFRGEPLNQTFPGYEVRAATEPDIDACNILCGKVHGVERDGELRDAIQLGHAMVVQHLGRTTGYTTGINFIGHSVGETNQDLMALIGAAPGFGHPGFFVPTRNHDLMSWCLGNGLRLHEQTTLMTIGLYNDPTAAWMPSVLF